MPEITKHVETEVMNEPNTLTWTECIATDVEKGRAFRSSDRPRQFPVWEVSRRSPIQAARFGILEPEPQS